MTPRDFCYWLQGFFELASQDASWDKNYPELSPAQVRTVENHLRLVFHHSIDPTHAGDPVELQEIHDGEKPQPGSNLNSDLLFNMPFVRC